MAVLENTVKIPGLASMPRVAGLQVVVRQETPFLPKVAFTLITLASLAGAVFTGTQLGLSGFELFPRWFTLWSIALAGGFVVWRVFYLTEYVEGVSSQRAVDAVNADALKRARAVGQILGVVVLLGVAGPLLTPYLNANSGLKWFLVLAQLTLAATLLLGIDNYWVAIAALVATVGLLAGWAYADAGWGSDWALRMLHLTAFTLWLGGAVWNIWVAMPTGRKHPNVDAVIAGAGQLNRFRWVVRFVLPTIIITGLIMAGAYTIFPFEWWVSFPGMLLPLKVTAILALVVVFITCPLFRHCSPVQGVCDLSDLEQEPAADQVEG